MTISGGESRRYAIIHVPIQEFKTDGSLEGYEQQLVEALEKGLYQASNAGCEQVTIDGARSGDLLWLSAEKAMMRAGCMRRTEVRTMVQD